MTKQKRINKIIDLSYKLQRAEAYLKYYNKSKAIEDVIRISKTIKQFKKTIAQHEKIYTREFGEVEL